MPLAGRCNTPASVPLQNPQRVALSFSILFCKSNKRNNRIINKNSGLSDLKKGRKRSEVVGSGINKIVKRSENFLIGASLQ